MEPELQNKVKTWKESMNEEQAKKLFIRNQALKAYKEDKVQENSTETIKTVIDTLTVCSMSKDQIALHIGQLEKARSILAALTQGYEIGYAEEKEPEFRAKHEKEQKEAKAKRIPGDSLSKLGISKEDLLAALAEIRSSKTPAPIIEKPNTGKTAIAVEKSTCEKCQKEFVTKLKSFHRC